MTYPQLTVSAVNHTAGTLTITAHGLITGGGFAASPRGPLYGGALYAPSGGVIPTGLAPVTPYWPIVVDANTIKLASSNANAMAGTALTFSSDGTLPLKFLVGLPYEVPRISAAGVQIFSDDDNTAWQALKAIWALLTGQAQTIWSTIVVALTVTFNALVTFAAGATAAVNQHFTVSGTGRYKHGTETLPLHGSIFVPITSATAVDYSSNGCMFTGGTGVQAHVTIPQGRRIAAVRFYVRDNSTGPSVLQCQVTRMDTAGATTGDISSGTAGNSTDQTKTVTPTTGRGDVITQAAHLLRVFYSSGSAQCRVYLTEVDYDFV